MHGCSLPSHPSILPFIHFYHLLILRVCLPIHLFSHLPLSSASPPLPFVLPPVHPSIHLPILLSSCLFAFPFICAASIHPSNQPFSHLPRSPSSPFLSSHMFSDLFSIYPSIYFYPPSVCPSAYLLEYPTHLSGSFLFILFVTPYFLLPTSPSIHISVHQSFFTSVPGVHSSLFHPSVQTC